MMEGEFYNNTAVILLHYIHQELVLCVIRQFTPYLHHYTCAEFSSFSFQSDQMFTCPIKRIRKGLNHPLQTNLNRI